MTEFQGYGAQATGGSGGTVKRVTNLNDDGTGSLRSAVGGSGPRIVEFDLSGIIELERDLVINAPDITVAGETAPGDGICLRNASLKVNKTHNFIIRHIRSRPGTRGPDGLGNRDGVQLEHSRIGIVDHCSVSWAVDETLTGWFDDTSDITIQWCILSEALHDAGHPKGKHSMGPLFGRGTSRLSILYNLIALNNRRNPRLSRASTVDVVNNIIYGWGGQGTDITTGNMSKDPQISGDMDINLVNNLYIPAPHSRLDQRLRVDVGDGSRIYIAGNLDHNGNSVDKPTQMESESSVLVSAPGVPLHEVAALPAEELPVVVLGNVGAFPRDPVDAAVIDAVLTREGDIIDRPSESVGGGYPAYETYETPAPEPEPTPEPTPDPEPEPEPTPEPTPEPEPDPDPTPVPEPSAWLCRFILVDGNLTMDWCKPD